MIRSAGNWRNHIWPAEWTGRLLQRPKFNSYFRKLIIALYRNLMAKDEFKNLGFADDQPAESKDNGAKVEKTEKNELKW